MAAHTSEGDRYVDALVQLSFVVQSILAATAAAHDLSAVQLRLLGILRDRQPSMQQLARILDLDKSSVTGLVDRAQKRGLVCRTTDPDDGRGVRVAITELGQHLASQGAADIRTSLAAISRPLSDSQRTLFVSVAEAVIEEAATAPE